VVQVREEGKRTTTAISGLDPFCAKLKEAASALAKKVGAGATVRPHPANPNISEVVVQVSLAPSTPLRTPLLPCLGLFSLTPPMHCPCTHGHPRTPPQGDITSSQDIEELLISLFKVPASAIVLKD
jgi:hypothetical protein